MSEYLIQGETLTGIADAIRSKTGASNSISVSDMAALIETLNGEASGGFLNNVSGTATYELVETMYEPGADLYHFECDGVQLTDIIVLKLTIQIYIVPSSTNVDDYYSYHDIFVVKTQTTSDPIVVSYISNECVEGHWSVDNGHLCFVGTITPYVSDPDINTSHITLEGFTFEAITV